MQGYKYEKTTGLFVEDIPFWDGEQPEDETFGITYLVPVAGNYVHKFDEVNQKWGEGKSQAEIDQLIADEERRATAIQLSNTDKEMARVGEDLLNLLISKGVITFDELPQRAQDKINERALLRGKLE